MTTPNAKLALASSILEEILKNVDPNSPTASKLRKIIISLDGLDAESSSFFSRLPPNTNVKLS
jgi:hypothetical protein